MSKNSIYQPFTQYIRDESNVENDGFKQYSDFNSLSDIGFDEITQQVWNQSLGNTVFGEYLGKSGLAVGDKIGRGQLYTLKIIAHRDYILQDTNINLPIPQRTDSQTMTESLRKCISDVQQSHGNQNKYGQYYYPAASYCYAYTPELPSNEKLADKFGEGRWALPSVGEMSRLVWYQNQGYIIGGNNNIFAQGVTDLRYNPMTSGNYRTSTECSGNSSPLSAPGVSSRPIQINVGKGVGNADILARPVISFKL